MKNMAKEIKLKCGCEAYVNMDGEIKIWNWVCDAHIKNKEYIIAEQKREREAGISTPD
jgi:hypothetical protein